MRRNLLRMTIDAGLRVKLTKVAGIHFKLTPLPVKKLCHLAHGYSRDGYSPRDSGGGETWLLPAPEPEIGNKRLDCHWELCFIFLFLVETFNSPWWIPKFAALAPCRMRICLYFFPSFSQKLSLFRQLSLSFSESSSRFNILCARSEALRTKLVILQWRWTLSKWTKQKKKRGRERRQGGSRKFDLIDGMQACATASSRWATGQPEQQRGSGTVDQVLISEGRNSGEEGKEKRVWDHEVCARGKTHAEGKTRGCKHTSE